MVVADLDNRPMPATEHVTVAEAERMAQHGDPWPVCGDGSATVHGRRYVLPQGAARAVAVTGRLGADGSRLAMAGKWARVDLG